MEERASTTVEARDEVCRRRKLLRFVCTLKHNWIVVTSTTEGAMLTTAIRPAVGDSIMVSMTSGDTVTAIPMSTASIIVPITLAGWIGAVATSSGASSPDIASHAKPAAS